MAKCFLAMFFAVFSTAIQAATCQTVENIPPYFSATASGDMTEPPPNPVPDGIVRNDGCLEDGPWRWSLFTGATLFDRGPNVNEQHFSIVLAAQHLDAPDEHLWTGDPFQKFVTLDIPQFYPIVDLRREVSTKYGGTVTALGADGVQVSIAGSGLRVDHDPYHHDVYGYSITIDIFGRDHQDPARIATPLVTT